MPSRIPLPSGLKAALLRRFDQRYVRAEQMHVVTERVHDLDQLLASRAASALSALETINELEQTLEAHIATEGAAQLVIDSLRESIATVRGEVDRMASENSAALQDQAIHLLRDAERRHGILYRQAEALVAVTTLLQPQRPLPPLGGWALSADAALFLVDHVLRDQPQNVVELGSGSSTVLLALALERTDSGRVTSFEHDADHLSKTQKDLDERGVSHRVDLIHAPLRDIEVGDDTYEWYAIPNDWDTVGPFDLILVDGPPSTDSLNRYPALPILGPGLRPGGVVIMDDAGRADEESIIARWHVAFPQYRLQIRGDHEKGTAVLVKDTAG